MNSEKMNDCRLTASGPFFVLLVFIFSSFNVYAEKFEGKIISKKVEIMRLEQGKGWKLDLLMNSEKQAVAVQQGTQVTVLFQDNRVSGKSGCNRYFADYESSGNSLTIGKAASTMMACQEPVMEQEQEFLERLSQVKLYAIENERLKLKNEIGQTVLVFSAIEALSLQVDTWRLISFNTGNALLSNEVTQQITAEFDNEGGMRGFAGCNQYSCAYKTDGNKLELSPIRTTRKYCPFPENVMKTEAGFIAALRDTVSYSMKNGELTLLNSENKPLAVFRKSE